MNHELNSQITAVTDDEHKKTSWKKWQGESVSL